ncbi:hypothetical protein AMS68_003950 [Peltaster fructicola]|uniref:Protein kinase domain-containing protein n=1 Tax=Peltaster fructicola TaxID=286661 RepID=A0A6H0XUM3_9PEZI|nr:hypothetical protein AMS68_003950 [Peltaster fructicola]
MAFWFFVKRTTRNHRRRESTVFRDNDWTVERRLTQGSGGTCYVVRNKKTGIVMVQKVIAEQHRRQTHELSRISYIKTLLMLDQILALTQWLTPHQNIVRVFSSDSATGVLNMEYCRGGDLDRQCDHFLNLRRRGHLTPESFQIHVFICMIYALAYVHHGLRVHETAASFRLEHQPRHVSIVHADIKPGNILLRWPGRIQGLPDVVLTDFGLCHPARHYGGQPGDPRFVAPEIAAYSWLQRDPAQHFQVVAREDLVSTAADVYSLGLTMVKVLGWSFAIGHDPAYFLPHVKSRALVRGIQACLQVDRACRIRIDNGAEGMLRRYLNELISARDYLLEVDGAPEQYFWATR